MHGTSWNYVARLAGKVLGTGNRLYDSAGNITFSSGATIPGAVTGYAINSLFIQNDALTPGDALYINLGTTTAASFTAYSAAAGTISVPVALNGGMAGGAGAGGVWGWTAPVACILVSVTEVHTAVSTGASTLTVRKITNVNTPQAAVASGIVELITPGFDLNGSLANTMVSKIPVVTAIPAQAKIGLAWSGAITGLAGSVVTLNLYPA